MPALRCVCGERVVLWRGGVGPWGAGRCRSLQKSAERVQLLYLRRLLGLRRSTASRVVLAECGRWPLALRWVKRLTKFYNNLVDEPEHSLLRRALKTSVEITSGKSWANQFAVVLESCGVEMIPDQPLDLQKVVKGWQHLVPMRYLRRQRHQEEALLYRGAGRLGGGAL